MDQQCNGGVDPDDITGAGQQQIKRGGRNIEGLKDIENIEDIELKWYFLKESC